MAYQEPNALPLTGQVTLFSGNFAPEDWMFCHGQILSINDNGALFSLLGFSYGGDGQNTFALPDLRTKATNQQEGSSASVNYIICVNSYYRNFPRRP